LLKTYSGGYSAYLTAVAFLPGGDMVATGDGGGKANVWNAATGAIIQTVTGQDGYLSSLAFTAGGAQLLTAGASNAAKLWDASTGELLTTYRGHSWFVASVGFSPDGSKVLTGGYDGMALIWYAGSPDWWLAFQMGRNWQETGYSGPCNLNGNGQVDDGDLQRMHQFWRR